MTENKFKRVVFSDVDGTIYEYPTRIITPENKRTIINAKVEDVEFVITTGNPLFQKMKDLTREFESRYLITSNGAEIYDTHESKYLYKKTISNSALSKIMSVVEKYNGGISWNNENGFGIYKVSNNTKKFLSEFNDFNYDSEPTPKIEDIFKIEILEPVHCIEQIYKELDSMNLDIEMVFLFDFIEITAKDVSKGSAVEWMCNNIFNTELKYVMAIGDSKNDLSMLSKVGYGYAMDNASDYVKSKVSLYTSDCKQNGLSEAIIDYVYRTKNDKMKSDVLDRVNSYKEKQRKKFNY
ncbi:HAD family hydrolase [Mycoplasma sp. ES3225-GEN-MYC]|uniref:Cof-type HAD-IIB family hydrolase n=1 Tax=Mycoplasma miroungigenitalium TaxID=754515 RepID=UPI001C128957|nr:Cof-type HAD-IIB family hydrolase [Mycoplasma miroungigenitalium]MBU4691595.1 HAD family hydrolase [Mycoplasma miroungigenitalium]